MHADILRARPGALPTARVDVAVVIDVLRMTTTASALLGLESCDSANVAATLEDLSALPGPMTDYVIVSELSAASQIGIRVDNSPVGVSQMDLANRTPVLVTSNGTKALLDAQTVADTVLTACFNDLHVVADYIQTLAVERALLVPAGHVERRETRAEDDGCADMLEAQLLGRYPEPGEFFRTIRADAHVQDRLRSEAALGADVDFALRTRTSRRVLRFVALGGGLGRLERVR